MSKKTICHVGPISNERLEEYHKLGYEIILLTDKDSKEKSLSPFVKRHFRCDLSSYESINQEICNQKINKPDIVLVNNESYVIRKSWLQKIWGIAGLTIEAAEASTDKIIMREKFKEHEIKTNTTFSPQFSEIKEEKDLINFAKDHDFPIILKPANLFKSILVTKAENLDELVTNYRKGILQIENEYQKNKIHQRKPRFLVEEFIEGKVCSVEAFVDDKGQCYYAPSVFDLTTAQDIGINDNYHYFGKLPSDFSKAITQELRETAKLGINALGLKQSAAHVELIYSKLGARIIEIGARLGGMRHNIFKSAYNISLIESEINIAQNITPNLNHELVAYVSLYELYPEKEGKFTKIKNLAKLKALKSLNSFNNKCKPGQMVGLSRDGYKCVANLSTVNKDIEQFKQDNLFIQNEVEVVVASTIQALKRKAT